VLSHSTKCRASRRIHVHKQNHAISLQLFDVAMISECVLFVIKTFAIFILNLTRALPHLTGFVTHYAFIQWSFFPNKAARSFHLAADVSTIQVQWLLWLPVEWRTRFDSQRGKFSPPRLGRLWAHPHSFVMDAGGSLALIKRPEHEALKTTACGCIQEIPTWPGFEPWPSAHEFSMLAQLICIALYMVTDLRCLKKTLRQHDL
jgi:hypothetical protein